MFPKTWKARLVVTKAIFDEAKKRQVGNRGLSSVKKRGKYEKGDNLKWSTYYVISFVSSFCKRVERIHDKILNEKVIV